MKPKKIKKTLHYWRKRAEQSEQACQDSRALRDIDFKQYLQKQKAWEASKDAQKVRTLERLEFMGQSMCRLADCMTKIVAPETY